MYKDILESKSLDNSIKYNAYKKTFGHNYMMHVIYDSALIYHVTNKGKVVILESLAFVIIIKIDMINLLKYYGVPEPTYREIKNVRKEQLIDILICKDKDELTLSLYKSIIDLQKKLYEYINYGRPENVHLDTILRRFYIDIYIIEKSYLRLLNL